MLGAKTKPLINHANVVPHETAAEPFRAGRNLVEMLLNKVLRFSMLQGLFKRKGVPKGTH